MDFIKAIENNLGVEAKKEFIEMQPGMFLLHLQIHLLWKIGSVTKPNTSVNDGISKFIRWYRNFYKC